MIPAKIIEISDKVRVEYYKEPYSKTDGTFVTHLTPTIAEVENVFKSSTFNDWRITAYCGEVEGEETLSLNQPCFIVPTTEGKCKIIKLNQ